MLDESEANIMIRFEF